VDATTALSSLRARMEQYYQDNRTYQSIGNFVSPCANSSAAGTFTVSCPTLQATSYLLQATGSGSTNGFVFTLDNNGTQATTGLPAAWGTVPQAGYTCWIAKKGGTC
jgi:type IV pilus assembly protein PilE